MLNTIAKWTALLSSVALIPVSWAQPGAASILLLLRLLVWAGIVVFVIQASTARRYVWAAGFLLLGVLLNPVITVPLSSALTLVVDFACAGLMAASLWLVPSRPVPTIASITDARPSESL
jgi:hypothetical protein